MAYTYDRDRRSWSYVLKLRKPTGEIYWKKKRGFRTKREAIQAANSDQASFTVAMSFADMLHKYEDYKQCSEVMIRKHKNHLEKRIPFRDDQISKLTKPKLLEWRNKLATSTEYSTSIKNDTIQLVRSVCRFATDVYNVPNNGIVLTSLKKTQAEEMAEMQIWDVDEFNRFLSAIPGDKYLYKVFFETLFWTGMRRGEAFALQVEDLKPDKTIYIHASKRNQQDALRPTKTRQNRRIGIDDNLYLELSSLADMYHSGYLFGGEVSLSPSNVSRVFEDAIKASGVKHIRIHDLRHSHASWLINNGVNIVAVSKRLGHATIEQTLKTYTHLLSSTEENMMQTINSAKS